MTASSRREKIEALLAEEPGDQFLRYSLALELGNEGQHEKSLEGLRGLMADDPPHVAAFFMAAQQLVKLGRMDEACVVLRDGIEQARGQGNAHAAGEMSELLISLAAPGHLQ